PIEMPSCLPEISQQEGFVLRPQIARGEDPELLHLRRRRRADTMKPLNRERFDKTRPHLRRDDEETIGLAMIRGELGEELGVRDARRRCQLCFGTDFRLDPFGDLYRGCD